ncbi:MAG TPA: PIG-L family deacetylase [Burkholderiales bacterium]|nr:PIG-L family deacetylase [Burkholderiales bacterium]
MLQEVAFPIPLRIAVLAPHPDDFDAIAVSMRLLQQRGHEIHVAVLTSGASGVEDGFQGARTPEEKAVIRETEQRASCTLFGLPTERLRFLRLWESEDATIDEERLRDYLRSLQPELVFLPHGNDSNRTHRRTFESFHGIASQDRMQLWACMNLDAKTLGMRNDLLTYFGEEEANWKAQLLRLHRSQHERNLRSRGLGFDERVLSVNRHAAAGSGHPYAEAFELQRYG